MHDSADREGEPMTHPDETEWHASVRTEAERHQGHPHAHLGMCGDRDDARDEVGLQR